MINAQKNGYSLVEVLVAVTILLLAIISPMTIAAKGLQSAYYAREQATALFLAQEGIELIVAMRNDAYIAAIQGGDLAGAWDWQDSGSALAANDCFSSSGCNITLESTAVSPTQGSASITSCGTPGNCVLSFDANNARARYYSQPGTDETKYTRTITLTRDGTDGVLITSIVSWDATIFAGAEQSVTLDSAVYRIY